MENIFWVMSYNKWVWVMEEKVKKLPRRVRLYDDNLQFVGYGCY